MAKPIVMIPMRGDEDIRTELREYARPVIFADWVRIACEEKLLRDRGVFLSNVDTKVADKDTKAQDCPKNQ